MFVVRNGMPQTFRAIPVPDQPIIRRGKGGHFWDGGLEGASHHAVIPNANTVEDLPGIWPRLSQDASSATASSPTSGAS